MPASVHVAILGATGYGAGELLRLLVQHPHADVVSISSSSRVDASVGEIHPHLRGFYDIRTCAAPDLKRLADADHAVVISALPHGASGAAIDKLLNSPDAPDALRIIDLSGDLRLKDAALHTESYPESPWLAQRREQFVYGLPELGRDALHNARFVANPGCLASAAILALAPLVADHGFSGTVAIDAKTGSSGSGRQLKDTTHHPTRYADFRAYKPLAHQHEPEIRQALGDAHGERVQVSFVAQSLPVARGIFVAAHLTLPEAATTDTLARRYADFYEASPFVRITSGSPALQDVVGSNFCDIGLATRGRQVIVMAALDNLIKGMAGTAIQNLNLMCGLPETTGLWSPSYRPL